MAQASPSEVASITVLVVDDEPQIVSLVSGILCRYKVLTAMSGVEAIERSEHFGGEIHLLLSDFQMPGMSGMDLATQITQARPKIQVLLMSGYPGGMLVLNEGWHFLAKPFIPSQLRSLVDSLVKR
jgi:CheY-like chemotaxis protein